jgi:transcriptional regulator with XRE-family HTH domain
MLGASKSTISHWETELHQPDLDELNAICNELNVTADWLLGRESAQLTAEGMREARAYEQLSPEDRRKWRALRNTMFDTST